MDTTVPIAAMVAVKDLDHGLTYIAVLIAQPQACLVIEVATARKPDDAKKLRQRIRSFQGINHLCLLPVCQGQGVDALVFFY
ncbi:hypothetical protein D3C72_2097340 [compost metagenome]